jgi:hypothetical protein
VAEGVGAIKHILIIALFAALISPAIAGDQGTKILEEQGTKLCQQTLLKLAYSDKETNENSSFQTVSKV